MRAYREAGQRSPGVLVSSNVHATAAWLCYDSFANDDLTTCRYCAYLLFFVIMAMYAMLYPSLLTRFVFKKPSTKNKSRGSAKTP